MPPSRVWSAGMPACRLTRRSSNGRGSAGATRSSSSARSSALTPSACGSRSMSKASRISTLRPRTGDCYRTASPPRAGGATRLFVGGEPVPERMWQEVSTAITDGRIEAANLYGPTECTVDVTATWISGGVPHIGRALPGARAYVLRPDLKPVSEPGEAGELYISGGGPGPGYLRPP